MNAAEDDWYDTETGKFNHSAIFLYLHGGVGVMMGWRAYSIHNICVPNICILLEYMYVWKIEEPYYDIFL